MRILNRLSFLVLLISLQPLPSHAFENDCARLQPLLEILRKGVSSPRQVTPTGAFSTTYTLLQSDTLICSASKVEAAAGSDDTWVIGLFDLIPKQLAVRISYFRHELDSFEHPNISSQADTNTFKEAVQTGSLRVNHLSLRLKKATQPNRDHEDHVFEFSILSRRLELNPPITGRVELPLLR